MLRTLLIRNTLNFPVHGHANPISRRTPAPTLSNLNPSSVRAFVLSEYHASEPSSSSSSDPPSLNFATHHGTEFIHYMLKGKLHSIASPQQEKRSGEDHPFWNDPEKYSIYLPEDLAVSQTRHEPQGLRDRLALRGLSVVTLFMNMMAKYKGPGQMSKEKWLDHVIYLETIGGCHGMIASMARHLRSLRSMTRDYGWISALLEESENERTHLLMLLEMKKPSLYYRFKLGLGQWFYFNVYFISYFLSPITAHRFVGYFHEETIDSYTKLLQDLKSGRLSKWGKEPAMNIGKTYYKLKGGGTVYDVFENIRADEANHRDVNHGFATDPILDPESIFLAQK